MPITARPRMMDRTVPLSAADGNSGTANRRKPNVPSFSMMLARTTEPAVGASTWASGSQVWNGNIGTFTANARKKATKHQKVAGPEIVNPVSAAWYEKFGTPVRGSASWNPMYTIATSMSSDPTIV